MTTCRGLEEYRGQAIVWRCRYGKQHAVWGWEAHRFCLNSYIVVEPSFLKQRTCELNMKANEYLF